MASIAKRPDGRWRARYRDDAGREHARHFPRRVDAQRWLDEVTASIVTGQYVAPGAGRITFRAYAEHWRAAQVHRPSTAEQVERHLRNHAYPAFGDRPLDAIQRSDVQAFVKRLDDRLSPATTTVVYRYISSIFRAAVTDRRLANSPCVGVKLPRPEARRVVPMKLVEVEAIRDAMPARSAAMVPLAAGTGMRQGEVFGLTLDRVDFLRRRVTVDRQLIGLSGREPTFGPPKTASSVRTVPLPQVVAEALAEHLRAFPVEPDGLMFTNPQGSPWRRSSFGDTWRRACREAGAEGHTFHSLRHFYASLLIRHGESVKTVQARLGHKSAAETLDTYSHLWPDSDDRTREAVDSVLGAAADSLRTAGGL